MSMSVKDRCNALKAKSQITCAKSALLFLSLSLSTMNPARIGLGSNPEIRGDCQYGTLRSVLTNVNIKVKVKLEIKLFLRLNTNHESCWKSGNFKTTYCIFIVTFILTHSEPLYWMAVNGQPITSRFIPSQTDAVPPGQKAGWATELDWALWRAIKLLPLPGVEPRFLGLPQLP